MVPSKCAASPLSNLPNSLDEFENKELIPITRPRSLFGVFICIIVPRITEFTVLAKPLMNSTTQDKMSDFEYENIIILSPKIATVKNNFNPCFLFNGIKINKTSITAPPKSAAMFSHAKPIGPTFKISFAIAGIIAVIPPKKTANKSSESAPSITLLLITNRTPSFILSQLLFSERKLSKTAGFGNNKYKIENEPKIKTAMITKDTVKPRYAIENPETACPKILPKSQDAELHVVAFGIKFFVIILGIIELNMGVKNDLIQPMQNIKI